MLKCHYCGAPTLMTARDYTGEVYNCCKGCKKSAGEKLTTSVVWKGEKKDDKQRSKTS